MSDTVASDQSLKAQKQKGARAKGKENRRNQPDFQIEVSALITSYFNSIYYFQFIT